MEDIIKEIQQRYYKDNGCPGSFYYEAYCALGGQCAREEYDKHLQVFHDITVDEWTGMGFPEKFDKEFKESVFEGDYTHAKKFLWKKWVDYLQDHGVFGEAGIIFESVDSITAYS